MEENRDLVFLLQRTDIFGESFESKVSISHIGEKITNALLECKRNGCVVRSEKCDSYLEITLHDAIEYLTERCGCVLQHE